MKLVRDYHHQGDAKEFSLKLRKKGILSFTAPSRATPNRPPSGLYKRHDFRVGVWVVLEEQFYDAVRLSKGNRHVVQNPLTEEEMKEIEISIEKLKYESRDRLLTTATLVVFVTLLVIVVLMY